MAETVCYTSVSWEVHFKSQKWQQYTRKYTLSLLIYWYWSTTLSISHSMCNWHFVLISTVTNIAFTVGNIHNTLLPITFIETCDYVFFIKCQGIKVKVSFSVERFFCITVLILHYRVYFSSWVYSEKKTPGIFWKKNTKRILDISVGFHNKEIITSLIPSG